MDNSEITEGQKYYAIIFFKSINHYKSHLGVGGLQNTQADTLLVES